MPPAPGLRGRPGPRPSPPRRPGAAAEAGGKALRCGRADRRGRRAAGCCRLLGSRADAAAAAAAARLFSMEPAGSARRTGRPRPGRSWRAGGRAGAAGADPARRRRRASSPPPPRWPRPPPRPRLPRRAGPASGRILVPCSFDPVPAALAPPPACTALAPPPALAAPCRAELRTALDPPLGASSAPKPNLGGLSSPPLAPPQASPGSAPRPSAPPRTPVLHYSPLRLRDAGSKGRVRKPEALTPHRVLGQIWGVESAVAGWGLPSETEVEASSLGSTASGGCDPQMESRDLRPSSLGLRSVWKSGKVQKPADCPCCPCSSVTPLLQALPLGRP
ncbi:uncharacterized protein LOC125283285 [Ursus arctos]|uniref:uncharacterized protein LOC125283285 n=1 Tax=Ursus arctos TaxID=9644 RepID=UPI0020170EE5|nr:uncharacterized protein LOC125283285 [Ursus arctos]